MLLLLLSPAKALDEQLMPSFASATMPEHLDKTKLLHDVLTTFSAKDISNLMHVSEKIAALNHERYQNFTLPFTPSNAKPSIFMFQGDVYQTLQADSLKDDSIQWLQKHLRILSGFYGLLRPLDLIQPYRLEMGTKLATPSAKNLYLFWKAHLTETVNQFCASEDIEYIVNLASKEYSKAIETKQLNVPTVEIVFKDWKAGQYKNIGLLAKRARGHMARFCAQHQVQSINDLRHFSEVGYKFSQDQSNEKQMIFLRKQ